MKNANLKGWKVSCTLDYQISMQELFVNGMSAESKDKLPKPFPKRISIVPVTRESAAIERLKPLASSSIVICFENEQELEDYQPLSLYPTKTKPEITGTAYLQAKIDISYPHGCGSGALLVYSNHLTRVLILGEELAELFESSDATDPIKAQQWIKEIYTNESIECKF